MAVRARTELVAATPTTEVRKAIATADLVLVSSASAWEVVVKRSLGKLTLPVAFGAMVEDAAFSELPVVHHAAALASLPPHHRDPFDRILIAQAVTGRSSIVTHDPAFEPYDLEILWTWPRTRPPLPAVYAGSPADSNVTSNGRPTYCSARLVIAAREPVR